ncbi:MAG: rRNA maturation RNase YbeY [Defluviitaleaceae bacterium]|nr:rRNA maturation RNase YbeY [Defluviitaleaceae bacterium]
MKILWDDRGATPVPKSLYVTMKRAALETFKNCFDEPNLKKLNYEVSVSLVSDEEMCELNKKYREKHVPTDVLSFPAAETQAAETFSLGDIVISTETAARQADEYDHSLERELSFLIIHGVLHLLGLDHETSPEDAAVMEEIQDHILRAL